MSASPAIPVICPSGKFAFATEAIALEEMHRLRAGRAEHISSAPTRSQHRKRRRQPVWKRAYLCPWCDHWHLTSKEEDHV